MLKLLDEATTDIGTRITERTMNRPDGRDEVIARMEATQAAWYASHERYLDAATSLVGSP